MTRPASKAASGISDSSRANTMQEHSTPHTACGGSCSPGMNASDTVYSLHEALTKRFTHNKGLGTNVHRRLLFTVFVRAPTSRTNGPSSRICTSRLQSRHNEYAITSQWPRVSDLIQDAGFLPGKQTHAVTSLIPLEYQLMSDSHPLRTYSYQREMQHRIRSDTQRSESTEETLRALRRKMSTKDTRQANQIGNLLTALNAAILKPPNRLPTCWIEHCHGTPVRTPNTR